MLIEIGLYKDALRILEDIVKEAAYKKHIILQVESHRQRGRIYGYLEFYEMAVNEFQRQAVLAGSIQDRIKSNLATLWAYQNLVFVYSQMNDSDGIEKYLDFQEQTLSKLDSNVFFYEFANFYTSKARFEIDQENFPYADSLINKSLQIIERNGIVALYEIYLAFAHLYDKQKDIKKASHYFQLGLENAESLEDLDASSNIAKSYSDFLLANNLERDKAQSLIIKYSAMKNSLSKANKYAVGEIYKELLKNKETDRIIIIYKYGFALLTSLTILFYARFFYKLKKSKPSTFNLPKQSEKYHASEGHREMEKNFDISDLIEMAKNGDPEFLFVFGAIYPEVINTFKELAPNMRSSEIYFLALCYLNFTPKEIARCSNVTVRAVQVRKNRYRKKFNIPSEIDFNFWINNLSNNSNSEQRMVVGDDV